MNEEEIKTVIKYALENMYMFGGMGRPDPNYNWYLNNMIETVMGEIKKQVAEIEFVSAD